MIIISPSYKRAGKVQVRDLFPEAILAIHEFEEEEYRQKEGGELLVMPDKVGGNMARVRNYMLNWAFERDEWVLMLDDDVSEIVYFESGGERNIITDHKQLMDFITNGFVMAEDMGVKLWGLNLLDDPQAYREYSPFSTLAVILGPFSAHIRNPLRYDERLGLKEDYDLALQHLRKYKGILRFNKYSYKVDHITLDGGCANYRMKDRERREIKIFQNKWGKKVVKIKDNSINPVVKCPLSGI